MELNMYNIRNYTEGKESGWLQKTDSRNFQKGRKVICLFSS